ncbi:MAG: hypothetical protein HQ583_10235 [Candidatus Abyssubacteria bacterium]|nr:hypothetical protein [Candidatus Abyssubacteria bacterium]
MAQRRTELSIIVFARDDKSLVDSVIDNLWKSRSRTAGYRFWNIAASQGSKLIIGAKRTGAA